MLVLLAQSAGCASAPGGRAPAAGTVGAEVTRLADRYYESALEASPEMAYFAGIDIERHDGLTDNSLAALQRQHEFEDELTGRVRAIDASALVGTPEWITYAYLRQLLESSIARRVCRNELWSVSQMGGWHLRYSRVAGLQPVGTPALRAQSLSRWSRFAGFIDTELGKLELGPAQGVTAPGAVVRRVIDQIDGVLALEIEQSPYYSPAARDGDPAFAAATRQVVATQIYPALRRYRDYLADEYLAVARTALSVTANRDGEKCYEASLRHYTTLDRTPEQVFELGKETVEANKQAVVDLGRRAYGIDDFEAIIVTAKSDPADKFADADEVLAFSRDAVRRAGEAMPGWVGNMPAREVNVVPFPAHEEGTGRSAHYRPGSKDRPGEYRIPLHDPTSRSRGNAESTAFHEGWPGHHLQVAVGQSIEGLHAITRIAWFSGPGEGWARYAEGLAEEMGLYTTTTGPILRRAWPARGMVVDPGIHLFGWTREQAGEFMRVSGRFPPGQVDAVIDRIAILPGQLTAYDSGGLEILALRREAQQAMGEDFDIRAFHDRILENGTIPLQQLRAHIEAWIAEYRARRGP